MGTTYDQWGNSYPTPDTQSLGARQIVDQLQDRHVVASILTKVTPERMMAAFAQADYGDLSAQIQLARDMRERDGHLRSLLQTRTLAVAMLDWQVIAGGEDAGSIEAAELFREEWEELETIEIIKRLMEAVFQQHAIEEVIWNTVETPWCPESLMQVDARRLVWPQFQSDTVATPRIRRNWGEQDGELPVPGKYIVHSCDAIHGLPGKMSLCRAVALAWMFKRFALADFALLVEKWGQPFLTVLHDPSATDEDIKKLLIRIAASTSQRVVAVPTGTTLNVSEGTAHITSVPQEKLITQCDEIMSKAILGNTTTSDAAQGNDSVSSPTHAKVTRLIRDADALGVAGTLNRDLARPWMRFNQMQFGMEAKAPKIVPTLADRPDPEKRGIIYRIAADLELMVKSEQVYRELGLEKPDGVPDVMQLKRAVAASPFGSPVGDPIMPPTPAASEN